MSKSTGKGGGGAGEQGLSPPAPRATFSKKFVGRRDRGGFEFEPGFFSGSAAASPMASQSRLRLVVCMHAYNSPPRWPPPPSLAPRQIAVGQRKNSLGVATKGPDCTCGRTLEGGIDGCGGSNQPCWIDDADGGEKECREWNVIRKIENGCSYVWRRGYLTSQKGMGVLLSPEGQRKVKVTNFDVSFSARDFFRLHSAKFSLFFSSHLVGRQRRKKYSNAEEEKAKIAQPHFNLLDNK